MSYALLVKDSNGQRELLLVGTVTIGRDPSCDISTADPRLSRRHAEFRVKPDGVVVFDLASRNGILVNGKKATEAMLKPGDTVQVANLTITLISEAERASTDAGPNDDKTSLIDMRPVLPTPAPGAFVPPAPPIAPPPPAVATPAADVSGAISMPGAGSEEDEKTRFISPPPGARLGPIPQVPAPPRAPQPAPASVAPVAVAAAPVASEAVAPASAPVAQPSEALGGKLAQRRARKARASWAGSVFLMVMALAVLVLLVSAVSLLWWNNRVVDAMGDEQAVALANWLAADAAKAIETGKEVSSAADEVGRSAGVISAVVVGLDGRVLAPGTRTNETLSSIPAVNAAPNDVLRLRVERDGAVIHVARPVRAKEQLRAAVVWVAYQATPPITAGSGPIVLGPSVLVAIVVSWLVAFRIRRITLGGLSALNEDVDLAMGGQLEEVADPLGAKPVAELAETFNYMLARLRSTGPMERRVKTPTSSSAARREASRPPVPASVVAAAQARAQPVPAAAPVLAGAQIVCDASFQVSAVSPACEALLGLPPQALLNKHLLQTNADKAFVDGVLKGLGAVGAAGHERVQVTTARGNRLSVTVSRTSSDSPITILIESA